MDIGVPVQTEDQKNAETDSQVRRWFDRGYAAFCQSFPVLATKIAQHPFYVCPQCLRAFNERAIDLRLLTREDVPPKSLGGRKIVLTCGECNWRAGHEMDAHARREADILDFFGGRLSEAQATIRTRSGQLAVRLSSEHRQVTMFGVPRATSPTDSDGLKTDLNWATLHDGWQELKINLQFKPFSPARAEASWVRSAYLAFFAALGYRFVVRTELDQVRRRIAQPNATTACSFRIVRPEPTSKPVLTVIKSPEAFRGFAMVYDQHIVFLPFYGDTDLYTRMEQHPAGHVELSADGVFPWPNQPLFLHDQG